MNAHDESVGIRVGLTDPTTRSCCPTVANEGITAIVKQKEGSDPEMVGQHWSGQPGKDLFFNNWKLLF